MTILARTLTATIAALFIVFGVLFTFFPEGRLSASDLEASSVLGLATIRALIGASFLTFGALLTIHTVIGKQTGALRFAILFLLLSVVSRILSLAVDGTTDQALRNLAPVSLMLAGAITALMLLGRGDSAIEAPSPA